MALSAQLGLSQTHSAAALLDYAERLSKRRTGRRVLVAHLSRLLDSNHTIQHCRIVISVFQTAIQGQEGELFIPENYDIVFVGFSRDAAAIEKAVKRIEFLLQGDPKLQDTSEGTGFFEWIELDIDFDRFLDYCRSLAVSAERKRLEAARGGAPSVSGEQRDISLAELADLERRLSSADIGSLVREQAVCAMGPNMKPTRVLTECFTSMQDLGKVLVPGIDLVRNRLLFQYLTQVLDSRMLAHLRKSETRKIRSFISINLNVSSVLSPEFISFDSELPVGVRGKLILELQQSDIFADIRDYNFARDFAKQQGYRICLDGVTLESLNLIDRRVLGVDFVKLTWNEELRLALENGRKDELKRAITQIGSRRVILHRCETDKAIRAGMELGIQLFQGHYLDALLPLHERDKHSALESMAERRRSQN